MKKFRETRIGRALWSIRKSPSLPSNGTGEHLENKDKENYQQSKTWRNKHGRKSKTTKKEKTTKTKQSKREGQFRNPDHFHLGTPAVVVHTYLTPGLGRRIPIPDELSEEAGMVHFVFEKLEGGIYEDYEEEDDVDNDSEKEHVFQREHFFPSEL